jgi:hypothetical protein
MRRLSSFFAVSLVTFALGVAAAWGYGLLAGSRRAPAEASAPRPEGKVRITFERIVTEEYGRYAEFRAVNGGTETLYYDGYDRDDHCDYKIRRGLNVEQKRPCTCGTGLETHALRPGRSATYRVNVRREPGPFEVGFDFKVGEKRRAETVWSETAVRP